MLERSTESDHTFGQIGGGGTYAALGARIWSVIRCKKPCSYCTDDNGSDFYGHNRYFSPDQRLPPSKIGMIVDRGSNFPQNVQQSLDVYGSEMWLFRDDPARVTTRAVNIYRGDNRG